MFSWPRHRTSSAHRGAELDLRVAALQSLGVYVFVSARPSLSLSPLHTHLFGYIFEFQNPGGSSGGGASGAKGIAGGGATRSADLRAGAGSSFPLVRVSGIAASPSFEVLVFLRGPVLCPEDFAVGVIPILASSTWWVS